MVGEVEKMVGFQNPGMSLELPLPRSLDTLGHKQEEESHLARAGTKITQRKSHGCVARGGSGQDVYKKWPVSALEDIPQPHSPGAESAALRGVMIREV